MMGADKPAGKPAVICIVGPTASGKTALAVEAALALDGEVVSSDAFQIYRGLDIGTAKPDAAERKGVPHHMLDVAEPGEERSAGVFVREADAAIRDILARGRLPIVAGGTGFYADSLLSGASYAPKADPRIRKELEAEAERHGAPHMHALLEQKDPESAAALHPNDIKRVLRALEIYAVTGRPRSLYRPGGEGNYAPLWIGVNILPRENLYAAIDGRVGRMLQKGLLDEVRGLLESGVSPDAPAMQAIGYKELIPVIRGECGLESAAELIGRRSRNYAKRQLTWFRRNGDITWFDYSGGQKEFEGVKHSAIAFIKDRIQGGKRNAKTGQYPGHLS